MTYFSFHFLLCNAIICIFLGILLGLKRLLQNQLSARMQYNLSIIFLAVLIVPFLPINSAPSSISWGHLLMPNSNTNGDIQTTFLSGNSYTLNKINDFAVSVSTQIPTFIHSLLIFFWSIGVFIMFVLLYRSAKQVKALHSSALPLQNEVINTLYIECLNEVNSKHTIPIYSTAFLKSPVLAGFLHPRIYLPIHLISDFNAGTISTTDIRYMLLHELQHYKHKDILIGYLINTVNVFYWFNPLIWYFLKRIRQERELACDSAVLQLLKETEYKSYGNTLINFAETIALSPFPFTMGISGNIKQLKGRILNIASFHQPTFKQKIRGYLICIFVSTIIIGCIPILSVYASDQTGYHFDTTEKNITQLNLSSNFGDYTGSFVLYDQSADKWNIYNMEHASTRVSPNSTYKIYDALLGLESGIITPEHSTFTWNGEPYPFNSWEADQDLTSAIHNSVNWYFQAIDSQAGFEAVRTFLQTINYGNQNTGTNLNLYWTDFSLKISPIEQVELLQNFYQNNFHFDRKNIQAVKNALLLSTTSSGSLYGKTGTGRVNGKDVNGWFVGYIESDNNTYYFATNIQAPSNATGSQATEITEAILSDFGIWK
ncbi:BlaR1 family beta-lactam sensor/signal transducer [Mediterraneibacter faecis]|uniref:BlaR1 family beta-lactam sensor/signal transducer n=1 Tax=Mediterraneibacter faecis TaxID=592978 RepID=UPI0022DFBC20|nr:BlaR1 family beta-lactam sensor/signal transducer [Mediterraneibacter faecis]